jgi:DNA excision repair protein ERCC-6
LDEFEVISDNESIDVIIIPPDVDSLTDEEHFDDNEVAINDVVDVPLDVCGTFEILTSCSDGDNSSKPNPFKKRKEILPKWKSKMHPTYTDIPINEEQKCVIQLVEKYGGTNVLQCFLLFFDDTVIDLIIDNSNKYATYCNRHNFSLKKTDLLKFIGIMILTSYHSLPKIDNYWSKDEDKEVLLVRKTMSRNKFKTIKQNLHLSDNKNLDLTDKFAKLRPFFNKLNEKFSQFGIFSHNLSIDEEMVPYFGRHSCKMFIKGKPVRFGFKLWCLTSENGYLYKFLPYGGASTKRAEGLPLGSEVVLSLLEIVDKPQYHKIFFDNFFTSYKLLSMLKEKHFFATGTVRDNRTGNCNLKSLKLMAKEPKGTFDFTFDSENEIGAVRWYDNAVVTIMSNVDTIEPLHAAKRYDRKQKKQTSVQQPNMIYNYNKNMGGVDLHDNGIANYRIKIRGKKWWWPLFSNAVDSTIVNAWKFYNMVNKEKVPQLDFRSELVLCLLKVETSQKDNDDNESQHSTTSNISLGQPSQNSLPDAIRKDCIDHIIIKDTVRRRCRQCSSQTIYSCKKCTVSLHPHCFAMFHDK